jgi:hypothetical protein
MVPLTWIISEPLKAPSPPALRKMTDRWENSAGRSARNRAQEQVSGMLGDRK